MYKKAVPKAKNICLINKNTIYSKKVELKLCIFYRENQKIKITEKFGEGGRAGERSRIKRNMHVGGNLKQNSKGESTC